jgi:hypothetical protein
MKGANAVELALLLAFEGISFGRRLRIGLEIDRQYAPAVPLLVFRAHQRDQVRSQ